MNSKKKQLEDVRISKRLSYLLRHGAVQEGLHINPDGFVPLRELLEKLPECTIVDIRRIVSTNSKGRFTLVESEDEGPQIKANQGHSLASVNRLSLKEVSNPNFEIIHGTSFANWAQIKCRGLSRMRRNHIHFSKDYSKSSADGIKFFESENGVVLSPGDACGVIETRYFSRVSTRDNKILSIDN
ncbi:tRNA 2'-phosphotransferase 1 isoform X2 [Fopius arisanus]|uniref:2'-phosphotransferase n=1 Tax=Fopius arisanus TaxID=64838 RepID=A0A9R1TV45_9HYME|nr:PREDICTED: tRNA 2'-phosphotransferase 1 isoform X2 [Fopius arisanus]